MSLFSARFQIDKRRIGASSSLRLGGGMMILCLLFMLQPVLAGAGAPGKTKGAAKASGTKSFTCKPGRKENFSLTYEPLRGRLLEYHYDGENPRGRVCVIGGSRSGKYLDYWDENWQDAGAVTRVEYPVYEPEPGMPKSFGTIVIERTPEGYRLQFQEVDGYRMSQEFCGVGMDLPRGIEVNTRTHRCESF